MNAKEYYEAGQLDNAIEAITTEVKNHPTDTNRRGFLCELLMIRRDWERADKQLDFIAHQNPNAMHTVALWRQLIRAGQAREQFYSEGRVPEVLEIPDELVQKYLLASVAMRENRLDEARQILEEAESQRPVRKVTVNGTNYDDIRDVDDVAPGVLEVLTSTGKYYWIPFSRIVSISFSKPECPLDVVLRRAHLQINEDGPDGDVYIPSVYHLMDENDREMSLLARATDWKGNENEPIRGTGQKMFLMGDEAKTILELEEVVFE